MADARLPRSTGVSILGLLPHNCLPHFTSCLTKTRLVTEFVTREDPGLTRSAQVEVGGPQLIYPGGLGKVSTWAEQLHEAASYRATVQSRGRAKGTTCDEVDL